MTTASPHDLPGSWDAFTISTTNPDQSFAFKPPYCIAEVECESEQKADEQKASGKSKAKLKLTGRETVPVKIKLTWHVWAWGGPSGVCAMLTAIDPNTNAGAPVTSGGPAPIDPNAPRPAGSYVPSTPPANGVDPNAGYGAPVDPDEEVEATAPPGSPASPAASAPDEQGTPCDFYSPDFARRGGSAILVTKVGAVKWAKGGWKGTCEIDAKEFVKPATASANVGTGVPTSAANAPQPAGSYVDGTGSYGNGWAIPPPPSGATPPPGELASSPPSPLDQT